MLATVICTAAPPPAGLPFSRMAASAPAFAAPKLQVPAAVVRLPVAPALKSEPLGEMPVGEAGGAGDCAMTGGDAGGVTDGGAADGDVVADQVAFVHLYHVPLRFLT